MYPQQQALLGALFIIASEFFFASMAGIVKHLALEMNEMMLIFARSFFGALVVLPFVLRGGQANLQTRVMPLHLARALFGLLAMYCFFYAIAHIPLADSMMLKMTTPIFLPWVALLFLREQVSWRAILAIPIGFMGVVFILQPHGSVQWVGLVGVLGGVFTALAMICVRRLTKTEPASRIVFYFALLSSMFSAVPLLWTWQMPTATQLSWLLLMGSLGSFGQYLLTRGYSLAGPAQNGPFTYFSVVFAALYGFVLWDERLQGWFYIGAALIALAGLVVLSTPAKTYQKVAEDVL